MTGLTRRMEHPTRHPANPLIAQDQPWERRSISLYGTVMFDPRVGKYRCWYSATESDDGVPDTPEAPGTKEYYQCYAESDDGIAWTKPPVGQVRYGRHVKHNIVIPDAHGFCVLPTPDDPDPARRYRGLGGNTLGFSPDGLVWDIHTSARKNWARAVRKNDTSSCVVRWNGEYLAFVRYQGAEHAVEDAKTGVTWRGVMRCVGICVSKDFVNWTPKKAVFKTDARDGYPWTQPYGICVTPYGDVLIGLLPMIRLVPKKGNNSYGPMDVEMVVSRDGRNWSRVADRAVFMTSAKPGPQNERPWDMLVYPGTTMFVRDDKVHVYYRGTNIRHGEGKAMAKIKASGIGLATLPADRFVALAPSTEGTEGVLQTRPLRPAGGDLLVNAELGDGGRMRVSLLDAAGAALDGFAAEDCRLVRRDGLRYRVVWGDGAQTRTIKDALARGPVAIRFALRGGRFYAFQIVP